MQGFPIAQDIFLPKNNVLFYLNLDSLYRNNSSKMVEEELREILKEYDAENIVDFLCVKRKAFSSGHSYRLIEWKVIWYIIGSFLETDFTKLQLESFTLGLEIFINKFHFFKYFNVRYKYIDYLRSLEYIIKKYQEFTKEQNVWRAERGLGPHCSFTLKIQKNKYYLLENDILDRLSFLQK